MKRSLSILLASTLLLTAVLFTGTFAFAEAPIVSARDTLVVGVAQEAVSFSPTATAGEGTARIKRQIMEGLFEINDAGEYVPLLAESWDWENDTTVLFHLRQGVTFSDGVPFIAQDVIDSILLNKTDAPGSLIDQYVDIDKTEILDDHTIRLVMTEPTPLLFDKFESQHFGVFHKATYDADSQHFMYTPIGTGPYKMESWKTGDSITLVRNETYWGTPAYCEKVIFRLIPESAQRTIELETGGIDINLDMSYDDLEYFSDENNFKTGEYAMSTVNAVFFNMSDIRKSPVQNPLVRQAIAYAIDSEAIAKHVYKVGAAANSNLSPFYAAHYDSSLTEDDVLYRQDYDKAKALLAQAGADNGMKLVMLLDEDPNNKAIAEIVQNQLSKINIELEIVTRSSTTWYATVLAKDEYDLVMFVLYDNSPVYSWMHFLDDGSMNMPDYTTWRNEKFENGLKELVRTTNIERQRELLREMDGYITEDLPVYSLHYITNVVTMRSEIAGFEYRLGMTNVNQIYFTK